MPPRSGSWRCHSPRRSRQRHSTSHQPSSGKPPKPLEDTHSSSCWSATSSGGKPKKRGHLGRGRNRSTSGHGSWPPAENNYERGLGTVLFEIFGLVFPGSSASEMGIAPAVRTFFAHVGAQYTDGLIRVPFTDAYWTMKRCPMDDARKNPVLGVISRLPPSSFLQSQS